jgi:purine nucleoside phosphorylase
MAKKKTAKKCKFLECKFVLYIDLFPPAPNIPYEGALQNQEFYDCVGMKTFPEIYLANSMELSPSSEAASHLATQKLLNILWNPKVH